jgi:hypothetical protein
MIFYFNRHYTKTNVKLEVCFTETLLDTGEEQAMSMRHKAVTHSRVGDGEPALNCQAVRYTHCHADKVENSN